LKINVVKWKNSYADGFAVGTGLKYVPTGLMLLARCQGGEAAPTAETVPVPTADLLAWPERVMCRRPRYFAVSKGSGRRHLDWFPQ
jgi:hypothetical protein